VATLLKKVIQMDGYRDEYVQGEFVISTGQLRLNLLAQSSSK
jgi:hypothetical protein